MKLALALLAALTLSASHPAAVLDSQTVLDRYSVRLLKSPEPSILIFTYAVSQAGPQDIDQTHRIYRSGIFVRDETLLVDGRPPVLKSIRIASYRNRYTLRNLAPALTQYAFLFLRPTRSGGRTDYVYRAIPLGAASPFVIERLTIDGRTYLPTEMLFRSVGSNAVATGAVTFTQAGKYWVPASINVRANVGGRSARERIVFSAYQFPRSLPKSTFKSPKPLPSAVLPTF